MVLFSKNGEGEKSTSIFFFFPSFSFPSLFETNYNSSLDG